MQTFFYFKIKGNVKKKDDDTLSNKSSRYLLTDQTVMNVNMESINRFKIFEYFQQKIDQNFNYVEFSLSNIAKDSNI